MPPKAWIKCENCGHWEVYTTFLTEDEAAGFICPECGMDESGLDLEELEDSGVDR